MCIKVPCLSVLIIEFAHKFNRTEFANKVNRQQVYWISANFFLFNSTKIAIDFKKVVENVVSHMNDSVWLSLVKKIDVT